MVPAYIAPIAYNHVFCEFKYHPDGGDGIFKIGTGMTPAYLLPRPMLRPSDELECSYVQGMAFLGVLHAKHAFEDWRSSDVGCICPISLIPMDPSSLIAT